MEFVTEPDVYSPSMDSVGNYVDSYPSSSTIERGVYCPCSKRKDMIYSTKAKLSSHFKTKGHQSWLETLNHDKTNYYDEAARSREQVKAQKHIIGYLDKKVTQLTIENIHMEQKLAQLTIENESLKKVISSISSVFEDVDID